jgi:hypothetical protein
VKKIPSLYVAYPMPSPEGVDEGLEVKDESGYQVMLLKHSILYEEPGRKGGPQAESDLFDVTSERPSAVDSPDLTPIPTRNEPTRRRHEFRLMDNDGNTIYLLRERTPKENTTAAAPRSSLSGTSPAAPESLPASGFDVAAPLKYEIVDRENRMVGTVERSASPAHENDWYLKDEGGRSVAFTKMKIKEDKGVLRVGTNKSLELDNIEGEWARNPGQENLADRFTLVLPSTGEPVAQVYPGTGSSGEGKDVGLTTSDAFEIRFDTQKLSREAGGEDEKKGGVHGATRTTDPRLLLCMVAVLNRVSKNETFA